MGFLFFSNNSISCSFSKKRGMFPDNFVVILPPVDEGAHPVQASNDAILLNKLNRSVQATFLVLSTTAALMHLAR